MLGRDCAIFDFRFLLLTVESKTVNQQSFHQQLLHRLAESAAAGYNVALLLCGASTEQVSTLVDRSVIRQVAPTHLHRSGATQ